MRVLAILIAIICFSFSVFSADFYWIGGSGDWSETTHWSVNSGGTSGTSIPGSGDNVFFDSGSGLVGTSVVTMDQDFNILNFRFDADSGNMVIPTGRILNIANFYYDSEDGSFTLGGTINVSGNFWEVNNATLLNWSLSGSDISFTNSGSVSFFGGGLSYENVTSQASVLEIHGNNFFTSLGLAPSSTLTLANNSTQTISSLSTSGTCVSGTTINTTNPAGVSATIQKSGSLVFIGSFLTIENVNAGLTGGYSYLLSGSSFANGSGWEHSGNAFYWIGNGGNWSDINHWSHSSGGTSAGCIPGYGDSVIFDANSFTIPDQTVLIDNEAYFSYMDWSTITSSQQLYLDTNIFSAGDITFSPHLFVSRDSINKQIEFTKSGALNANGALLDCNISVFTMDDTDVVVLTHNLIMTDSSEIYLTKGNLNFDGFDVGCGSIFVLEAAGNNKGIDFGSSNISLSSGFSAKNVTNFTFDAGTSDLYIGGVNSLSFLISPGLTFNNVTLDFIDDMRYIDSLGVEQSGEIQNLTGNNTFNNLYILPGSNIFIDSTSTQTVNNTLSMKGNCQDSIYLTSTNTQTAYFHKTSTTNVVAECIRFSNIGASGVTQTALFSTGTGSNPGWILNPAPSVTSGFSMSGSFCFGDTVLFSNNSTVYTGNPADMISVWYFGDESTGYYDYPSPGDSVWINYEQDTNKHVFTIDGDLNVILQTTNLLNFCQSIDSMHVRISNPGIQLTASDLDRAICSGEEVTFEVTSDSPVAEFEFFLNGISIAGPSVDDTLYVTTALTHLDTISAISYENGCVSNTMPKIGFTVNDLPDFSWTSSASDTSACFSDLVSFSAAASEPYTYQYLVNSNPVSLGADYSTSLLEDSDTVLLVATTSNYCRDTLSMIFDVKPLPSTVLSSSVSGNVICSGDEVLFTGSGASQYEFFVDGVSQGLPSTANVWSTNGLTTGGVVTVIGYSVDGCQKIANESFTYTVNNLPVINLVPSKPTNICSGESVSFSASGASQYEFFVDGVSVQGPSSVNSYNTSSLSDQDVVYVTGTFSGCSNTSVTHTFSVSASPVTTLISDATGNTSCHQQSVLFTSGGADNYEFFVNGVSQGVSSPVNTFSASSLLNGQTVTVNGESNGCIVSQSITITVLPVPSVNIFSNDPDNAICEGESITFTGTNAVQYQLYVNSIPQGVPQAAPTFTPALIAGNHSIYIIGTAANGCSSTSQNILSVIVNPIPTVVLSSSDTDAEICANESVTFTGTGSNLYQFFINGVSQGSMSSNNTFTTSDLQNGQMISVVGSSAGCTNTSNTITFTVNPSPTVLLSSTDIDNVFCLGESVDFNASGATSYEFIVNGVSQGTPSTSTTLNSVSFVPGTYLVEVYGEQSNCNGYNAISVTVNDIPTVFITASETVICSGENVVYSAGGGSLYEFFVNGNSQGIPSLLNAFSSSSLADGDVVSVNVTSVLGCHNSALTTPITVNPTPVVTITSSDTDNEICVNETVIFTGSGAAEYEFFINGISQGAPSTTSTLSTSTLNNGDVVSVTGSNLGCLASSSQIITTVNSYPTVNLINNGSSQICENEPINVSATGAINYRFLVNGNPVTGFTSSPDFTGTVNNNDVVTVSGELNGCITTSGTGIQYSVLPYPTINAVSSDVDNTICKDELVTVTTSGATEYEYQLNGNTIQLGANSVFSSNTLETTDVITVIGYNGDCASAPVQFVFTVNEMNLNLTATPSNLICDETPVTFTASGADLYRFVLNGVVQGTTSAVNSVTFSNLNDLDEITFVGESNSTLCVQNHIGFIIMNVMQTPVIYANSSYDFCDGDSVVLISNSSYGNQWLLNGNPIVGATDTFYVAYQQGVYSLEVTHGGNGSIWSFGGNAGGTFGNGTNFNSPVPTKAEITQSFIGLSSGYDFVLALTQQGRVYSWGKNNFGQLGNGTYTNSNVPALLSSLSDIKAIATAEASSMAITNTGNVYVWGENNLGQLGTGNTSVINFPYLNPSLADVDTLVAGKNHFLFLKNDGTVWATGYNASGQLGKGNLINSFQVAQVSGLTNIVAIGAGENSSYAIDNTGNLYVWGGNGSGQLGLGDLTNRLTPVLSPLKKVRSVQGGAVHSVFTTTDNQIHTVGGNNYGQLGLGDLVNRVVPEKVNLSGVRQASAGQYTTLIKRIDNSVFGFGDNSTGQLSTITGTSINTPVHINNLDGVVFVESGRLTSHVIFGNHNSCTPSSDVNVVVYNFPSVVITVTSDTVLTATAGADSYQWYMNDLPIPGATSQVYASNTTGNYTVEATFGNGCTGVSDGQYIGFIGLDENEFSLSLIGYPNPAIETFYLGFNNFLEGEQITIVMTDHAGREVKRIETTIQPLIEISLSDLVSGSYQTIVRYKNYEKVMKLIKVN